MPRANPDVNYEISIHALLAESDRSLLLPVRGSRISIHALLAESDDADRAALCERCIFLSTLSLRRATSSHLVRNSQNSNFYPRSPCGERLTMPDLCQRYVWISIHALLAESDEQSASYNAYLEISIHALLAESDLFLRSGPMTRRYFYPRSPCGERPVHFMRSWTTITFLSTLSLRRATPSRGTPGRDPGISIHALLAESDLAHLDAALDELISIHALLAESDQPQRV